MQEVIGLNDVGVGGVVLGLTQLVKQYVPERFVSLVPLVIGILASLVIDGLTIESGIKGLVIGLTTAGLYDQKKVVVK